MIETTRSSRLPPPRIFRVENVEVVGAGGRADEIVVDSSKSSKSQKIVKS